MPASIPKPDRRIRLIGHAICQVVARAPWAWPLIRGRVDSYFAALARGWDERTGAGGSDHLAPLAAAVLHVRPSPERVLDVGCGTGAATLFLAREFPQARVRGVDLSEEMISIASGKVGLDPEGRVAFRVGDASDLPYPDQQFDLVAQVNMPVFFDEIARVVRPDGFVAIVSSAGPDTPFHTPEKLVRWKFAQRGIEQVATGGAANGTYYVGRRSGEAP